MPDIEKFNRKFFGLIGCEQFFLCIAVSVAGSSDAEAVRPQVQSLAIGVNIQQLGCEVGVPLPDRT